MIGRPRQHPSELRPTDSPLELPGLLRRVLYRALVVFRYAELQVLLDVRHCAGQGLGELEFLDRIRASSHDPLRPLGVLPEPGLAGDLVELGNPPL